MQVNQELELRQIFLCKDLELFLIITRYHLMKSLGKCLFMLMKVQRRTKHMLMGNYLQQTLNFKTVIEYCLEITICM